MMEEIQKQFDISEYSVTQTTLEQIFNNFAQADLKSKGRGRASTARRATKKGKEELRESNVSLQ